MANPIVHASDTLAPRNSPARRGAVLVLTGREMVLVRGALISAGLVEPRFEADALAALAVIDRAAGVKS